jgi:hypothetical protein
MKRWFSPRVRIALGAIISVFWVLYVVFVLGELVRPTPVATGGPPPPPPTFNSPAWVTLTLVLAPILFGIVGAISGPLNLVLAWRADRRNAREAELRIMKLEAELAVLRATEEKRSLAGRSEHPTD